MQTNGEMCSLQLNYDFDAQISSMYLDVSSKAMSNTKMVFAPFYFKDLFYGQFKSNFL